MALKKLNDFIFFDFKKFWEGKAGVCTSLEPWIDFESKKVVGTKAKIAIVKDETQYRQKDGENVTNKFESFIVKIPKTEVNDLVDRPVRIINPVATVYGQYRNELSVKADDVQAIPAHPQGGRQ